MEKKFKKLGISIRKRNIDNSFKLVTFLLFLIFLFLFPKKSVVILAQTALKPGEINFTIQPIILRGEGIYLSGNESYITAYTQAYYQDLSYREIGMNCYLNGDEFNATQNCSVQFYPEKGVCSILYPQYSSLVSENMIKCKIYDPKYPTEMYVNKSFVPLKFSVWFSEYSTIVGEEFNFPVNIKNSGLFSDKYNLTAWIREGEDLAKINPTTKHLLIELHGDAFDPHFWNRTGPETKQVNIKVVILDASSDLSICINVTSLTNTSYSYKDCKKLSAQFKSMSEPNLLQILFIMLVVAVFIFKYKEKF